jgi:hypothetical protein
MMLLIGSFHAYLVDQNLRQNQRERQRQRIQVQKCSLKITSETTPGMISWIEKLLTISISDYRKYCIWRILAPYLVNIKNLPDEQARQIIREWLKKCNLVKRISFDEASRIRYDIQSARRKRFYPIRWEQLKIENTDLFNLLDNT